MRVKAVGTAEFVPGHYGTPFTVEETWQMPDRYRSEATLNVDGKIVKQEALPSDYKEKERLKRFSKVSVLRDRVMVIDAKATELQFYDKVDPKIFAKP